MRTGLVLQRYGFPIFVFVSLVFYMGDYLLFTCVARQTAVDVVSVDLTPRQCRSDRFNKTHTKQEAIPGRKSVALSPRPLWIESAAVGVDPLCSCEGIGDAGHCFLDSVEPEAVIVSSKSTVSVSCLPSFIIVGAMKSGTGELMKWLNLHPNLKSGKSKSGKNEIHFFGSEDYNDAHCIVREYAGLFGSTLGGAKSTFFFDKSPDYMRSRTKMQQIASLMPSVKIIVSLRHPVVRAVSEFAHNCRHRRYGRLTSDMKWCPPQEHSLSSQGDSASSFVSKGTVVALDHVARGSFVPVEGSCHQESVDIPADLVQHPCRTVDFVEYVMSLSTLETTPQVSVGAEEELSHGYYDVQMEWLLDIFPAEQVLILFQEDMYRNTFRTLRQVEDFLGIPNFNYAENAVLNANGPPFRKPADFSEHLFGYWTSLKRHFLGKNEESRKMLEDLSLESSPRPSSGYVRKSNNDAIAESRDDAMRFSKTRSMLLNHFHPHVESLRTRFSESFPHLKIPASWDNPDQN